jgi:hypothetical protein
MSYFNQYDQCKHDTQEEIRQKFWKICNTNKTLLKLKLKDLESIESDLFGSVSPKAPKR